jgi:IS605 OrfB family transposase
MNLIYSFYIPQTEHLVNLCKVSNNLYNQALYLFRQTLKNENKWLWYADMDKLMKNTPNLEGEINYRLLKAQVSQQILKVLDKNIKAYCKAIKDFKTNPAKYKAMPQLPSFRKRSGLFNLYYPNQSAIIKNGKIRLAKDLEILIPQWDKYKERIQNFQQVRILPSGKKLKVEIVYRQEVKDADLDKSKYASIDLGIDNLATMVTDKGSFLYSGKFLKSYNGNFNRQLAKLKSIKDKQGIKKATKRMQNLYEKRDRYFEDAFHKYSRMIVNHLIENRIGNLVVGYNTGWKQSVNIGKRNNQKFVQIPFARLASYLKYKCRMAGIRFVENEESYTSKCDALAKEEIGKHESYLGKRVKRGLFRSSTGRYINADVNGAVNILRKVVGDSDCISQITGSGRLLRPIRYSSPFRVA